MRAAAMIFGAVLIFDAAAALGTDPRAEARELVGRAVKAYRARKWIEAGELYLRAFEIVETNRFTPKPDLLYNAALAFDEAGACDRAAALYDRFLEARPDASAGAADLAKRVADARACAPEVRVETTPPGAAVVIDGQSRGVTPAVVRLKLGKHEVAISLAGHQGVEEAITVVRGKPMAISRRLEVIAAPAAAEPVVVREAPVPAIAPPVVIAPPVRVEERGPPAGVWVSGGAGAAALVAAVVMRLLSMAAVGRYEEELDRQLALPSDRRMSSLVRDRVDEAVAWETASNVSLGIAVAAIGGAAIWWIADGDREPRARIEADGGGLAISW